MADKIEIEIALKNANQTVASLQKVKQSVTDIEKEGKSLETSTNKSTSFLKSSFAKAAIAIGASMVIIKKAFDITEPAAKFEQSMEAARKQFGIDADAMVAKLREVSGGTITNAKLIEGANKAMSLNVTRDIGEMAKLMEIARVRARAMGIDTAFAFDSIVTGIGRGSPLILDNLGIVTKGWDEEAKQAGVAMDAQFILNKVLNDGAEILKKTGPLSLTASENFQKFKTSIENLWDSIGQRLIPIFNALLPKIGLVIDSISKLVGRKTTDELIKNKEDEILSIKKELAEFEKAIAQKKKGMNDEAIDMKAYREKKKELSDAEKELTELQKENTVSIDNNTNALNKSAVAVSKKRKEDDIQIISFDTLNDELPEFNDLLYETIKAENDASEAVLKNNEALANQKGNLDGLAGAFSALGTSDGALAAAIVKQAELIVESRILTTETENQANAADRLANSWSQVAGVIGIVKAAMSALSQTFMDVGVVLEEEMGTDTGIGRFGVWLQDTSKLIDALNTGGIPGLIRAIHYLKNEINSIDTTTGETGAERRGLVGTEAERGTQSTSEYDKNQKNKLLITSGAVAGGLLGAAFVAGQTGIPSIKRRANGGMVTANTPYLIGERGPELMVPSRSGTVIPNESLVGNTYNFNGVTVKANNIDEFFKSMQQYQRKNGKLA